MMMESLKNETPNRKVSNSSTGASCMGYLGGHGAFGSVGYMTTKKPTKRKACSTLVMTFTVEIENPEDTLISQEDLDENYGGDWSRFVSYFYEEEGMWFDEELKLVKVEVLPKRKVKKGK